jgi:hypothetical protein
MKDDFAKYEAMKKEGASPEDVHREAVRDGIDNITVVRLIRHVFSLSLAEAKEVRLKAVGIADSLEKHESRIADEILPELERRCQKRSQ